MAEKKILVPNSIRTKPWEENSENNSKKIKKNPFPALCFAKRDEIGREREKTILIPSSVHTRPGQDNSKKNSKKIQKIKKPLSSIIFGQNGMR